jgi:predicted metal-dependent peptidase
MGDPYSTSHDLMKQAISLLVCHQPFYAAILLRLRRLPGYVVHTPKGDLVYDGPCPCPPGVVWPQCPHSMATDGTHLIWNPRFVMHLAPRRAEIRGVICHEVVHVAAMHHLRRGHREPRRWNYACDQAVNQIVRDSNLALPEHVIPGVPNKSAEELYELLPPEAGGTGLDCLAGIRGQEHGQPANRFVGDVFEPRNSDGTPLNDDQRRERENETRIMVQQAYNAAKQAGTVPASVKRLVDAALEPRVPWQEILSRFIDRNQRNDYSWTQPNRRYVHSGVILPALWTPGYGRVLLACDTSGSIDQEMLKVICSELLGCLDTYAERGQPTELDVIWFDTAAYHQVVSDASELAPKGGGGTSYAPISQWVEKNGPECKAIIVVTDGHCNSYGKDLGLPWLFILTHPNSGFKPPYGEITCTIQ